MEVSTMDSLTRKVLSPRSIRDRDIGKIQTHFKPFSISFSFPIRIVLHSSPYHQLCTMAANHFLSQCTNLKCYVMQIEHLKVEQFKGYPFGFKTYWSLGFGGGGLTPRLSDFFSAFFLRITYISK